LKNKVPKQMIADLDDFSNDSSDAFSELSENEPENFTD
jgi:hypothetical protein